VINVQNRVKLEGITEKAMMSTQEKTQVQNYASFISNFESGLKTIFENRNSDDDNFFQRGFSDETLSAIMSFKPLSVSIPTEYGGRGVKVKECLGLLEAASYESLPLSLVFGINFALFLEPFAKYGQDEMKHSVFNSFLNKQSMGGLMISEPLYGSDALSMQTSNVKDENGHFLINGTKHWQGLTGMADYWLVACRSKNAEGKLSRDIDMFLTDQSADKQQIIVEHYYKNNGLYPIPYGKNILDLNVPPSNKLVPETTGIKMLMDILHRSRMQFPGMAMGFLKRIMEEGQSYCDNRMIRGNSLLQFDQVKLQVAGLQNAFTICSAMCHYSSKVSAYENNLALYGVEANTIKAFVTDLMQSSAQTLTQLMGSEGYKIKSLGSRGIMDSRLFQIFEGPNELLYSQISEAICKDFQRKKSVSLLSYLGEHHLTSKAASMFGADIDFKVERSQSQRRHVILGKVLSRIISAQFTLELGESGFNKNLVNNAISGIVIETKNLISSLHVENGLQPVSSFKEDASWKCIS